MEQLEGRQLLTTAPTFTNGSFENDLSGWSVTTQDGGSTTVVSNWAAVPSGSGSPASYSPIDGSKFAVLKTNSASAVYTIVSQDFAASAGDKITGYAFFDTSDYLPYNDDAQVRIKSEGTVIATPFSESVSTVGDYGQTPWKQWQHTFTASGIYSIEGRISNALDGIFHSYLGLDAVAIVPDNSTNTPPVLDSIGNKSVVKTTELTFTATGSDSDVPTNTLTFSLADGLAGNVPAGAGITSGGVFTWTPTLDQGPASYTFDVVVSDGQGGEDFETVTITTLAAGIFGGNVLVAGTSGNDTVSITASSASAVSATVNGLPYGPFSIPGGHIIANAFAGDDLLSISGTVDAHINMGTGEGDSLTLWATDGPDTISILATVVTINGSSTFYTDVEALFVFALDGDDDISEDGSDSPTYFIDGGTGNDTYTLHGSTVNVTDYGGGDSYFEDAGEGSTVNIDDHGEGADTYTLHGSTVNVTDYGGGDSYFEDAGEGSEVNIDDHGEGADTYTLHGSTVNVTDYGGGDSYFEDAEEGSSVTIEDQGGGDDTYTLHGSTVIVKDDSGSDTYEFTGSGSSITIEDTGTGENRMDLTDFDEALGITVSDTSAAFKTLAGTAIATFNGRVASVSGSDYGDVIFVKTTSGKTAVKARGGNDQIDASESTSENTLDAGSGNDEVKGGSGQDTYVMVPGSDDTIIEPASSTSSDTLDFSGAARGITVDLSKSAGQWQTVDSAGNRVKLTGTFENVIGSESADDVTGNSANNRLEGRGGNDVLEGAAGNDILVGGNGDDELTGSSGRDLLIGGWGADRLVGASDEDIMIAGYTAHDSNDAALISIMAEWTRSGLTAQQRAEHLSGGTPNGLNGLVFLKATGSDRSVFDDLSVDKITGGSGTDWLFYNFTGSGIKDTLTGNTNDDIKTDINA